MVAVTDQAIDQIKQLIIDGEFSPGSRLPKEQELAQRLGLSRNSLREAVRALTLIGVLEPRVGDGTYITSLEPELLLAGMGFVSDLLRGEKLVELQQVRRILEPVATAMAATRLGEDDYVALEACLERMDSAETTQAFIAADEEFHRIIVTASGNSTLASLIQNLSGGTLRARLWVAATEQGAIETTRQRHRDILEALREGDAELARAADLIHLSEGEVWLRKLTEDGSRVVRMTCERPELACLPGDAGAGSAKTDAARSGSRRISLTTRSIEALGPRSFASSRCATSWMLESRSAS